MRPCSVLRNGVKVAAYLVRCGPKNSRVSFNGDRSCTELVSSDTVYEIMESSPKPTSTTPYVDLATQAAEIGAKMTGALAAAGIDAAPHMNLQEKLDAIRGLRDATHVVVDGELWTREDAEAAGAIEPEETPEPATSAA